MLRRTVPLALAAVTGLLVSCSSASAPTVAGPPGVSDWPQAGYDAAHSSGTGALGPQTKHIRWTASLGDNITPGPVISADGYVLQATNAGTLYALDRRTAINAGTSTAAHPTDRTYPPAQPC